MQKNLIEDRLEDLDSRVDINKSYIHENLNQKADLIHTHEFSDINVDIATLDDINSIFII